MQVTSWIGIQCSASKLNCMVQLFFFQTGTQSYLKSNISTALWLEASVHYASDPPPFYPQTFKLFADTALYDLLGLSQADIVAGNTRDLQFLVYIAD